MKSGLIKIICNVLGKGLVFVVSHDSEAKRDYETLPKEIAISLGIFGEGNYLVCVKKGETLSINPKVVPDIDLAINFKNRKSAKKVLLGSIGVRESFSRHDILLSGNINTAVTLVRIIEKTEYYLFPRIITRKFLPKMNKEFCSLKLYAHCLFGSKNLKPNKDVKATEEKVMLKEKPTEASEIKETKSKEKQKLDSENDNKISKDKE